MKPGHVFLDELNANSKAYKVKVKVIEKGRAKTSPKKGLLYQSLLLEDEKGNKMRGALFGDQVEGYKEAFVYNGVYEIANAPIKPCSQQWQSGPDELDYQMSFGRQTIIQPANDQSGPVLPDYLNISQIPKGGDTNDKYDIIGVVIYVEEDARNIKTARGQDVLVREIVITDHTTDQPLVISVWNDLAESGCAPILAWADKFNVVGFTALRITSHKGFSLTSSMSTIITLDPTGQKTAVLGKWVEQHQDALSDRQGRVLQVRDASQEESSLTLKALAKKTAHNTLQEERHTVKVVVPNAEFDKVYAYLGCSNCSSRSEIPVGRTFTCSKCCKKDSVCLPRITFNCEMADGRSNSAVTMFTEDSVRAFGMTAADIFRMIQSDDHRTFERVQALLKTAEFSVELRPKNTLSTNHILQWTLRQVVVQERSGYILGEPNTVHEQTLSSTAAASHTLIVDSATSQEKFLTTDEEQLQPFPVNLNLEISSTPKNVSGA